MLALPVSTALLAYVLLDERMTRVRWISFALALAGVLECSGVDWKELNLTSSRFLVGNVLIFLSVNGSAFYNAYSKRLLKRFSPLEVLLYSYYAVFIFMLPITLAVEPSGFVNLPHFTWKFGLASRVSPSASIFFPWFCFSTCSPGLTRRRRRCATT